MTTNNDLAESVLHLSAFRERSPTSARSASQTASQQTRGIRDRQRGPENGWVSFENAPKAVRRALQNGGALSGSFPRNAREPGDCPRQLRVSFLECRPGCVK